MVGSKFPFHLPTACRQTISKTCGPSWNIYTKFIIHSRAGQREALYSATFLALMHLHHPPTLNLKAWRKTFKVAPLVLPAFWRFRLFWFTSRSLRRTIQIQSPWKRRRRIAQSNWPSKSLELSCHHHHHHLRDEKFPNHDHVASSDGFRGFGCCNGNINFQLYPCCWRWFGNYCWCTSYDQDGGGGGGFCGLRNRCGKPSNTGRVVWGHHPQRANFLRHGLGHRDGAWGGGGETNFGWTENWMIMNPNFIWNLK